MPNTYIYRYIYLIYCSLDVNLQSPINNHVNNVSSGDKIEFYIMTLFFPLRGPSWSWSYCSWIISYLCNTCKCPSRITLWRKLTATI